MSNSKEIIYQISAILILASAVLYSFLPAIAPWILIVAVLALSAITASTPYPGKSIRGKRLFGFQVFSCMFMIVSAYLMLRNNNLWALTMMVGAVFLLYSAFMLPKELKKEESEKEEKDV
ncbi:MAG: hypothetical protein Q4G48_00935 [Bacteroidia bacterium]|nr:hypothetical protein [Bacteroidia bacterium]